MQEESVGHIWKKPHMLLLIVCFYFLGSLIFVQSVAIFPFLWLKENIYYWGATCTAMNCSVKALLEFHLATNLSCKTKARTSKSAPTQNCLGELSILGKRSQGNSDRKESFRSNCKIDRQLFLPDFRKDECIFFLLHIKKSYINEQSLLYCIIMNTMICTQKKPTSLCSTKTAYNRALDVNVVILHYLMWEDKKSFTTEDCQLMESSSFSVWQWIFRGIMGCFEDVPVFCCFFLVCFSAFSVDFIIQLNHLTGSLTAVWKAHCALPEMEH